MACRDSLLSGTGTDRKYFSIWKGLLERVAPADGRYRRHTPATRSARYRRTGFGPRLKAVTDN